MPRHKRGGRRRRARRRSGLRGVLAAVATIAAGVLVISFLNSDPQKRDEQSTDPPTPHRNATQTESPKASDDVNVKPPATQEAELDVPSTGDGVFKPAAGESLHEHSSGIPQTKYTVEVEGGLPFDPATTAAQIEAILDDQRGWPSVAGRELHRVPEQGEFRVLLATPETTDRLCAPLETNGRVSCRNGDLVVLNARRWAFGIDDYDDIDQYRTYLVNHEFGHALGYGHAECPGEGKPAPVMQQQTYGLNGCRANVWPTVA